jgi:hypothetical protein
VNGETGGFVEDDEMGILKEHIEEDVLCYQVGEGFGWRHQEFDVIALAEGGFGPTWMPLTRT